MERRPTLLLSAALAGLLGLAPSTGCAHRDTVQELPVAGLEASHQLLGLAHEAFDDEKYGRAVGLFRQSFLAAPPDSTGDGIRHVAVARMSESLLAAYAIDGDHRHLENAKSVLDRYLAKIEAINGDPEVRMEHMGLSVLRSRVDEAMVPAPTDPAPTDSASPETGDGVLATAPARSSTRAPEASRKSHAGESLDSERGMAREVVVRPRFATLDDPRVRAFHNSASLLGPSMLSVRGEPLHGPRVLLRLGAGSVPEGAADTADRRAARAHARGLVAKNRERLLDCYYDAMGRHPVMVSRLAVNMRVGEDGELEDIALDDGPMIDARGDLCLAEVIADAGRESDVRLAQAVTVRVPMLFFYQSARPGGGGGAVAEYDATRQTDFDSSMAKSGDPASLGTKTGRVR